MEDAIRTTKYNRYLKAFQAGTFPEARSRVCILLVVSNPLDPNLTSLNSLREIGQMYAALRRTGLPIALIRLNPPTWAELQNTLFSKSFPILHFIGHGNEEGIWLENERGQADFVRSVDLGGIICQGGTSLVILNTCESWGPAQALVDAGVKALIASKRPLVDAIGPYIAETLYSALIRGQSIVESVEAAQKVVSRSFGAIGRDLLIALGEGKDETLSISQETLDLDADVWVYFGEPVHNLEQSPMDNFIGRRQELTEQIFNFLRDPNHRAIALEGLGGIGKSTLAIATAWRYSWMFTDGIVYITARDNESFGLEAIVRKIDQTLMWNIGTGDLEVRVQRVLDKLGRSQVLLILDNLDSVTRENRNEIVHFLARWDTRLGGKAILTMREHLLEFDVVVRDAFINIDSLDIKSATVLLRQLTQDRSIVDISDDEEKIREATNLAYRHPLLIELTAGLLNGGSTWNEVWDSLSTLSGVYDKIHEILATMTKRLLAQHPTIPYLLKSWSIFRGGATSAAWEAVVQPYLLSMPIVKSNVQEGLRLIRQSGLFVRDNTRHYQAHPLVTQYLRIHIWEDLPPGDKRQISENFLRYFLNYVEDSTSGRTQNMALLDLEHLNLRHALQIAHDLEEWDVVKSIVKNFSEFLDVQGYWGEWEKMIQKGLVAAEKTQDKENEAKFIYRQAQLYKRRAKYDDALRQLKEGESLAKAINDKKLLARITGQAGMILLLQGDLKKAQEYFLESLQELSSLGDIGRCAIVYRRLAQISHQLDNLDEMREYASQSYKLEVHELQGGRDWGVAESAMLLGKLATETGDFDGARQLFEQALPTLRDSKNASRQLYAELLHAMAVLDIKQGNFQAGRKLLTKSLELANNIGDVYRASQVEAELKVIEHK